MTDTLTITVDDAAVRAAFKRLTAFGRDASPMFAEIAEYLVESTQRRFDTSTAPDGMPWAALKDGSGRKPLVKSGTLRDQIFPSHGPTWAEIASPTAYARFHQEGTEPYVIFPRNKKALAWPGGKHPVRKVNHPGLPARPFMGLSEEDRQTIGKIAGSYLHHLASS